MTNFDQLIINLRNEIEALKSVKRRSSLTQETITKTVSGTAVAYYTSGGSVVTRAALIEFIPADPSNPFLFSWALVPYSQRNRNITVIPWTTSNGNPGVVLVPSLSTGESGNISVSAIITSTGDFTATSSQIIYDGRY